MRKTWKRLLKYIGWNLVVSFTVSGVIWKFVLGRNFNLHWGYMEIDFFNTLGVAFTIIGLMIALYQIAELQSRQEVIAATTTEVKRQAFKLNALDHYFSIRSKTKDLQRRITQETSFSDRTVNGYIELLTDCVNSLNSILEYQKKLGSDPIIDCEKCVTLLSEIRADAYKVVEERSYPSFKKQTFILKLGEALKIMNEHEANLKS